MRCPPRDSLGQGAEQSPVRGEPEGVRWGGKDRGKEKVLVQIHEM